MEAGKAAVHVSYVCKFVRSPQSTRQMTCAWYLKVYLYGFKAVPAYGFTVYGHPSAVRRLM